MSDLMKCLYDFVQDWRMRSIYADPEYAEVSRSVDTQMKKIQQTMSKEQQEELSLLLENISAQSSIESKYLFQAALKLARELSRAA